MSSSAQLSMRSNVAQNMNDSAALHTVRSVAQNMKINAKLFLKEFVKPPNQVMELPKATDPLLLQPVEIFHNNNVRKFQNSSVKIYQNKNARAFQKKNDH